MKPQRMDGAGLLLFIALIQGAPFARAQAPVQAWVQSYPATTPVRRAIAVDTNGNVFVGGSYSSVTNYSFATVAYSNTGRPLWTNRYDIEAHSAQPSGLTVGRDGTVFVTGYTYVPAGGGGGTDSKFATVAYSNNGVALWTNIFSEGNGGGSAAAIAVGQSGTIFILGGSALGMTTLAYSSAGVPLWTNHYQGGALGTAAIGLGVDDQENVFVAGYAGNDSKNNHYVAVAYSGAGVQLWTNEYISTLNVFERATAMAVDGNGNVFLTGFGYKTNGVPDCLTVACSRAGVPLWTNRYGAGSDYFTTQAIAADTNGIVFVTGYCWGNSDFYDCATVAYSAAGSALWTNHHFSFYPNNDIPPRLAAVADNRGHVVVTGYGGTDYYATMWYDSTSGTALWTNRYNGPSYGIQQAKGLAVDVAGNVFVTATSPEGMTTIKYALPQPVRLLVQRLGDQVVLNWTNAAFGLQSAPTLSDVFTNVLGATSPYTNPISGGSQFFRLSPM
jgi:hypothetical protein